MFNKRLTMKKSRRRRRLFFFNKKNLDLKKMMILKNIMHLKTKNYFMNEIIDK
jgi:hypothetical protein